MTPGSRSNEPAPHGPPKRTERGWLKGTAPPTGLNRPVGLPPKPEPQAAPSDSSNEPAPSDSADKAS